MRIYHLMKDRGMSQKELAEKLDKRPSEINKWLGGEHNLTLRTIAKIEDVLGEDIINVPQRRSFNYDKGSTFSRKTTFTVTKNDSKIKKGANDYDFVVADDKSVFKKIAS